MVWLPFVLTVFAAFARNASVFTVYRSTTTTSEWNTHLGNANAADRGGALSYLHTEVLPFSIGRPTCTRRWKYDMIAIFEVTVMNPPNYPGGNGPNIGIGFNAMDGGKCTVPKCQEQYEKDGFSVGGQTQKGNCRAAYGDIAGSAYWYSFPEEGQCAQPDGSKRCTYIARYVGKLKIDDLVNTPNKQIVPNYRDWCMAGGVEFKAEDTACPGCCKVQSSLDFWKAPCDSAMCQKRVDWLSKSVFIDHSLPNGCDGSTPNTFKSNGQCVRNCPAKTFLDWDYNCVACDPILHCTSCNWATAPPSVSSGSGGTRCLSCDADYPVLTADGRCLKAAFALDEDGVGGGPGQAATLPAVIIGLFALLVIVSLVFWRVRAQRKQRMRDVHVHEMSQYQPPEVLS